MFWKFFRLQTLINALFDDSWCDLGLPEAFDGLDIASVEPI
jgi:hypothetical protein